MATSTTALGLEKTRKAKGITLQEVAEITRISPGFLIAIENEEFEKLPGGVFDRNYLRQYAQAVRADDTKLMAKYDLYAADQERKAQAAQPRRRNFALRWIESLVAF